ncbi:hypothetical protein KVR01_008564 [Diaporthe batatas]|uniref:uncharacterized protein n=1 Tax=Diaporthe batatas TaxID=748121 RepID=UPI001D04683C|nr:uncharacterized protein KVR01_008564 [Diaporthe batatas]KAG8161577.1 hypothetical protein KVR01_008564 [Diaporthe batatas]
MEFSMNWTLLGGAVVAYYVTLVFYRLFLHPLALFPGPRLAAVSRWYEGYYDVVLDGQYTSKIGELHRIYGPIIRISPHELHVNDPKFFDTIYCMDGRWDKYSWAYDAFGARNSTIFGSGHDNHKSRRRAIATFFSKPNIASRQPVLRRNLDKLCQRISGLTGSTFNLGAAISAFTRDSANELIVGRQYNELDSDDFGVGLSIASQGAGPFWRITKHVHWFGPTIRGMPIDWAMKMADDNTKAFLGCLMQSEQHTRETLAAAAASPPSDKSAGETMIHAIVYSDLPPAEKTFDRVLEEVMTVTGAAFETTASALRLILFHVYTNEEILRRLRIEITSLSENSYDAIDLKKLEQLPYLTAVLTEGMRLSPAISSRAARVSDKDLFYDKWRIPAGTPVGMTTLLLHTDEELYPDPMCFNPDRWLVSAAGEATASLYAPFGRGTRICVGMHLAWAEMYQLVAALVQRFDFTIKDATAADFELYQDNFGIGTRAGCDLLVHATPYNL